jgi:hypothetical protein
MPPWMVNLELAYTITHEVFYVTDFGFKPYRLDPNIRAYIQTWLPSWLKIYAEKADFDLTAELIMTDACIEGQGFDDYVALLVRSQHNMGYMPGPPMTGATLKSDFDLPERVVFLENYHSTLVTIMALIMHRNISTTKNNSLTWHVKIS